MSKENPTILEKIQTNQHGCLDNPSLLSEYLVILCSHIIDAENKKVIAYIEYAKVWSGIRPSVASDKACDMRLKQEKVYIEIKATEALCRTVLETIRAIKVRLKFLLVDYNENLSNPR